MKILLVNPPFRRMTGMADFYYPAGLASLAAVCKDLGHEVIVYDVDRSSKKQGSLSYGTEYYQMENYLKVINDSYNPLWIEIREFISRYNPDIVGIRAQTTTYISAAKTAENTKMANRNIKVIMGGPHPTIRPLQVLEDENVDFVLDDIKVNKNEYKSIPGLYYKVNGKIENTGIRKFVENADLLPLPDRASLKYLKNYSSEDLGVIMASRGCPFSCSYCFSMWGKKVRYRTVKNVLEEVKQVKKNYSTYQFSFKDDTFTLNKKWINEFCGELLSKNIKINWDCTTRADTLDDDLLRIMKKSGCNVIKLGVESGSKKILEDLKKGETMDEIRQTAKLLNKHNIYWSAYFIFGLPQETEKDIELTCDFMRELNPPYASIGPYKAFPNTNLFNQGVEMGILKEDMQREEYFKINPLDYYYKNPEKRTITINKEQFEKISEKVLGIFDSNNKRFYSLFRRGLARKDVYINNPLMLKSDFGKLISWMKK